MFFCFKIVFKFGRRSQGLPRTPGDPQGAPREPRGTPGCKERNKKNTLMKKPLWGANGDGELNYLCQVVPAGREIKLLVSSSSRARNCGKIDFPMKFHEHLSARHEISRRIQWKPPRAPEIGQKSIF